MQVEVEGVYFGVKGVKVRFSGRRLRCSLGLKRWRWRLKGVV